MRAQNGTSMWAVASVMTLLAAGAIGLGGILGTWANRPVDAAQLPYCEEDRCEKMECAHDGFSGQNCDQQLVYCVSSICMP